LYNFFITNGSLKKKMEILEACYPLTEKKKKQGINQIIKMGLNG